MVAHRSVDNSLSSQSSLPAHAKGRAELQPHVVARQAPEQVGFGPDRPSVGQPQIDATSAAPQRLVERALEDAVACDDGPPES
jgi:hypothetical protein